MKRLRALLIGIWMSVFLVGGLLGWFAWQNGLFLEKNPPEASARLIESSPSPQGGPLPIGSATAPEPPATPTGTSTLPATVIPTPAYTPEPPPGINPLTGLRPAAPGLLERRPMAVKITNFPRYVRETQSGLTRADVTFEYYIEDGISRFIAVFYGQDAEKAGPVRSGRYFDGHVARMFQAILVFANADERVEREFIDSDLLPYLFVERGDNCPPLCRDKTIAGFNNLFIDTRGVADFLAYRQTDNERRPLRQMYYSDNFLGLAETPANTIYTFYSAFSYNFWEYDPARQVYLRYSDMVDALGDTKEVYAPHIDKLTRQQVQAANVVVLLVPHNFRNDYDRADQVFDIAITGSGRAFVFRDGLMLEALWLRNAPDQPIQLVSANGEVIGLRPGQTFYQVMNPESRISQSGRAIEFTFYVPPRFFTPTPTPTKSKPSPTPKK